MQELRNKYPPNPVDIPLSAPPANDLASPVIATVKEVMKAMKSFSRGSGAGPHGLRPGHLETLMKEIDGGARVRLASTLTKFVHLTLQDEIPPLTRKVVKHDGIRPIGFGNTLRRLPTKVGCATLVNSFGQSIQSWGLLQRRLRGDLACHASLRRQLPT